ncbi:hypothetical protein BDV96DRAFT_647294 [Lophiotrema nucula]|uniref:SET domain-containing protein n=1 Tax=Lophiotrema nucula TaxID=690887 RepID=A0A6A5Z533_9PLEO|nr:hypothetical protein BDV96DRAFT_647294 [Lophiotrema nucula]
MLHFWTPLRLLGLYLANLHFRIVLADLGAVQIEELLHAKIQQHILNPSASTQKIIQSPWSHNAYCKRSSDLSTAGKKFCVYTSDTTGPHGVSIIASPETAAKVAESRLLDNDPLESFRNSHENEDQFVNDPLYEVKEIEGKGMGVIATRKIKKFETVMVDQASILEDIDAVKALGKKDEKSILALAVKQLKSPNAVTELSADHGNQVEKDLNLKDGGLEADVMYTNAFGSDIAGKKMRALFPLISRINHACSPNTFVLFSRAGISMAIKAYRDIEPGEELSISYLTLGQTFARRQDALKHKWGFTCTCKLCSLPHAERVASDIRQTLIKQTETKILELWEEGKHKEALGLAEESIEMIKEEGLDHFVPDQYALLAKLWLLLGKRKKAEEIGKKSWELLRQMGYLGTGEEFAWDLDNFLNMVGDGALKAVVEPRM